MLPDDVKHRIRAEEIYREEVRAKLRDPSTAGTRAWAFLNSSFGMWVLTTVLVGLATWGFTAWRDSVTRASERSTVVRRLDTEIATRLDRFVIRMSHLHSARQFGDALEALDRPDDNLYASSAYPEYARRSLLSLARELREYVSEKEAPEVDRVLRNSLRLARIGAGTVDARVDSVAGRLPINQRDLAEVKRLVGDSLRIKRWTYATFDP